MALRQIMAPVECAAVHTCLDTSTGRPRGGRGVRRDEGQANLRPAQQYSLRGSVFQVCIIPVLDTALPAFGEEEGWWWWGWVEVWGLLV